MSPGASKHEAQWLRFAASCRKCGQEVTSRTIHFSADHVPMKEEVEKQASADVQVATAHAGRCGGPSDLRLSVSSSEALSKEEIRQIMRGLAWQETTD